MVPIPEYSPGSTLIDDSVSCHLTIMAFAPVPAARRRIGCDRGEPLASRAPDCECDDCMENGRGRAGGCTRVRRVRGMGTTGGADTGRRVRRW